jgi:hypothetical protein
MIADQLSSPIPRAVKNGRERTVHDDGLQLEESGCVGARRSFIP